MTLSDKTIITQNFRDIIFLGHNFYGSKVTRDDFTYLSLSLHTEDEIPTRSNLSCVFVAWYMIVDRNLT